MRFIEKYHPFNKNLKSVLCVTIFLGLLVCALFHFGATAAHSDKKQSLQGLRGILVQIETNPAMDQDGLSAKRIKSDVETKLKGMGIAVLTDKNWDDTHGRPFILISINGTKIQDNWKFYTYSVTLRLFQDVTLIRKPELGIVQASTWYYEFSGHGYLDDIRIKVIEAMDVFGQDYRTSN